MAAPANKVNHDIVTGDAHDPVPDNVEEHPAQFRQTPPADDDYYGEAAREWQVEEQMTKLQGKPMAEVFAVRANFRDPGTIVVLDGKGGQIIYKPDQGTAADPPIDHREVLLPRQKYRHLVLTGPNRAISASASISIELHNSTTDRSSDGGNTLQQIWDGYDDEDDATGNTVLTPTIMTGQGRVFVTYALLPDAVEATVQVKVMLGEKGAVTASDDVLVYGKIAARCLDFNYRSVLFRRGPNEMVAVACDYQVPLARSIVAVPFLPVVDEATPGTASRTWPFVIEANIKASSTQLGMGVDLNELFHFQPRPSGEQVEHFHIIHGKMEIKVTWSLGF